MSKCEKCGEEKTQLYHKCKERVTTNNTCKGTAHKNTRSERRCNNKALIGSDYCRSHQ